MGLDDWQCHNAVHLHQFGVRSNNGMFVAGRYVSCYVTKICFAAVFDCLFQQSVHDLPLDRHDFGIHWNDYIYGGGAERSEFVDKERFEREEEGRLNG